MNVVSLGEFKELKKMKKNEDNYLRYLKTLGNTQLEFEVNALLEEFSGDTYDKDYFSKSQILLKEITARADRPVALKIEAFTKDTLKLL